MTARWIAAAILACAAMGAHVQAALSLPNLNDYSQLFNFLATTGDNVTWNDNAVSTTTNGSPGWYWQHVGTSVGYDTVNSTSSGLAGSRFSYGSTAAPTDRAMGSFSKPTDNTNTAWGVVFQNNSGLAIQQITVKYDGEQWRRGALGQQANPDKLLFSYITSATEITTLDPSVAAPAGWTPVPALTFNQLQFLDTNYQIDGNNAANRTANITATITVHVPVGEFLALRWYDGEMAGQTDAGMGVDNLLVQFVSAVPEPSAFLLGGVAAGAAALTYGSRRLATMRRRPIACPGI